YDAQAVLVYDGKLYQLKEAHAANADWDASKADEVTVVDLISAAEPESLTTEQTNALLALLD
nr:hypothetical protein [Lachnospiraceae bacterium]